MFKKNLRLIGLPARVLRPPKNNDQIYRNLRNTNISLNTEKFHLKAQLLPLALA